MNQFGLAEKARAFKKANLPTSVLSPFAGILRRRQSPETVDEVVQRYQSGEHTTAISQEDGISKSGLINLLRTQGVMLRSCPITPADIERAISPNEQGLTMERVAEQVGYSYGTILMALNGESVHVRESCVRRK